MAKKKVSKDLEIVNRKARHEYFIVDTIETGILLTGTEVKSIKNSMVNLKESYCFFMKGELWVKGMHVTIYKNAAYNNHQPTSIRKLLMHKKELVKLEKRLKEKGLTIVPYRVYTNDRGIIKMEIAVVKGKKKYDKRDSMKERDTKRDLDRYKKMH